MMIVIKLVYYKNRELNNLKVNELLCITALKKKGGNDRVSFKSF